MRQLQAGHVADDVAQQDDAEVVVGVLREVVADEMPPRVPSGRPSSDRPARVRRHAVDGADRRRSSDADGQAADLARRPSGTARAATARRAARRRCCRSRCSRRRPAGARRRRCRGRAGRGRRCRIRCGSGDEAASGRGWAWRAPRDRARFRATRRRPSSVASSGRGMPCGGIMPPRSFLHDLFPDLRVSGGARDVDRVFVERRARRSWLGRCGR